MKKFKKLAHNILSDKRGLENSSQAESSVIVQHK